MTSANALQIDLISADALKQTAVAESWRTLTSGRDGYCSDLGWLLATSRGLKHEAYGIVARRGDDWIGLLPLSYICSTLFGKFLVSLPYVNTAGVVAADEEVASALIDRAVELADTLDVRYLELRHEKKIVHPQLLQQRTDKVHMRLPLPASSDELWKALSPKVRNQIRKGQKQDFEIRWGQKEQLDSFYAVFSRNMRDLGTPVFSRRLFAEILEEYPDRAELCTVHASGRPAAAALLVHAPEMTQVPSASALRAFNSQNVNMLMYWHLLCRSIERGQTTFDFGRSSQESSTFRFKKQWGAQGEPAVWQYYVRKGAISEMRPESGKYRYLIKIWQRLPLPLSQWIGPPIVRGIP